MTTAADIMTLDPITIAAGDTIRQAAMMMADLKVGSLPVCRDGKLVGTVTDRDIAVRAVASGVEPTTPVEKIASEPAQWCLETDDIKQVERKMAQAHIRRLAVLDDQKRLVGMIALGDVAASDDEDVARTLKGVSSPARPDR
ncbi:CBS domain-containing protein [Paraburkholderia diazotrophica]|uniref:CBS domain-containing protein n=1 Tax=Paraburkholderia diazotrophica TaxID=667676 RepID=UPI00316D9155